LKSNRIRHMPETGPCREIFTTRNSGTAFCSALLKIRQNRRVARNYLTYEPSGGTVNSSECLSLKEKTNWEHEVLKEASPNPNRHLYYTVMALSATCGRHLDG
jgi:hypothetical protein